MSVVNVKKKELKKLGYEDFEDWNSDPDHVYIGRNMVFYVPGTTKSPWANPFSWKKYGREGCIEKYREWLVDQLQDPVKLTAFKQLKGKTLGCWCKPLSCHGDIILELL